MPSLSDLGKFKSSFNNIANEKNDVLTQNMPFDDLALPSTEAPPLDFSRQNNTSQNNTSDMSFGDEPQSDDFDFNAFINDVPDNDNLPSETPSDEALSALDDFLKDLNPDS